MNIKNSSIHSRKYKLILSAVHMVYRLVNSTYNVKELVLRLTRLLCQFIKASSSTIYILDPKKKKVVLKAVFDNKINILLDKRKELSSISEKEAQVLKGFSIFEDQLLGLPLVADEIVGAIFIKRKKGEIPFNDFDKEMLSVVVEQSVTAIKNLQLYEEQQKIILESIKFIGELLRQHSAVLQKRNSSVYFNIVHSLGEELKISKEQINNLFYASILREAGAIDIPYNVLSKSSQLTPEEFKLIRDQPARAVELIKPVDFLKPVLPIILYYNEKYDGSGYPSGLKKEQIPLGARIISVVDAFLAMTSDRPYKKRLSFQEAVKEVKFNSGTQFDPKVAEAFIGLTKQKKFRNYLCSDKK
ncbi:MAG: HD-GYP domain-containing protein [Candidatus Omnitrophota bacterium]